MFLSNNNTKHQKAVSPSGRRIFRIGRPDTIEFHGPPSVRAGLAGSKPIGICRISAPLADQDPEYHQPEYENQEGTEKKVNSTFQLAIRLNGGLYRPRLPRDQGCRNKVIRVMGEILQGKAFPDRASSSVRSGCCRFEASG